MDRRFPRLCRVAQCGRLCRAQPTLSLNSYSVNYSISFIAVRSRALDARISRAAWKLHASELWYSLVASLAIWLTDEVRTAPAASGVASRRNNEASELPEEIINKQWPSYYIIEMLKSLARRFPRRAFNESGFRCKPLPGASHFFVPRTRDTLIRRSSGLKTWTFRWRLDKVELISRSLSQRSEREILRRFDSVFEPKLRDFWGNDVAIGGWNTLEVRCTRIPRVFLVVRAPFWPFSRRPPCRHMVQKFPDLQRFSLKFWTHFACTRACANSSALALSARDVEFQYFLKKLFEWLPISPG